MDHPLSQARQRAVLAILVQQQQMIGEFQESLRDLAAMCAKDAGLEGEYTFANDRPGIVVLREVRPPEPPAEAS